MAGHSKWANIKHRKGRQDAKKGKVWSKISKQIMAAARNGGGDPDSNLDLRYAIDEARQANMPKDTIRNAIRKGTGDIEGISFERVVYEGYGPGGVAILVDALTDNRNRTAPEIRKIFDRAGCQLGASNCVAYMFEKKGTFIVSSNVTDEDTLMEAVLEAGADDVTREGDYFEVTCGPGDFGKVKASLKKAGIETVGSEIAMVPGNMIAVDRNTAGKVLELLEILDDHDDVQKVYSNLDIPDELTDELTGELTGK